MAALKIVWSETASEVWYSPKSGNIPFLIFLIKTFKGKNINSIESLYLCDVSYPRR